jgi:hypothetical protein
MKNFYLLFLFALFFIASCSTDPIKPTPIQIQDNKVLEQHLAIEKEQGWKRDSFITYTDMINVPDIFENTLLNYNYLEYGDTPTYNQIYNDNKGLAALEAHAIDGFVYVKNLKYEDEQDPKPEHTAVEFDIDGIKDNIHVRISLDPEDFVYMTEPCKFSLIDSFFQNKLTYRSMPEMCNYEPTCMHKYASTFQGGTWTIYATDWFSMYHEYKDCKLQRQPYYNVNFQMFKKYVLRRTAKEKPDESPFYQGKNLFSYRYMHIFNFITNMLTLGYAGKVEITAPENVKKEIENNANKITYATMGIGDLIPYKAILTPENKLLFSLFAYAIHNSTITKKEVN